jgi:dynein heavy chain
MIFIFSFIWSAGANLFDNPANPKDSSRARFSSVSKNKFLKILTTFPYEGDVYDHYLNIEKKEFRPWSDLVTQFKYIKDMPFFNILVPTADTVKFKYLLDHLMRGG